MSPSHRTGTLHNLTPEEVQTTLGFAPFVDEKGGQYWGFEYDGLQFVIWRKKADTLKTFATQGRESALRALFGNKYRPSV